MPGEDYIGFVGVKDVPEGLDLEAIVGCTGSIEGVVEVGQGAPLWIVV